MAFRVDAGDRARGRSNRRLFLGTMGRFCRPEAAGGIPLSDKPSIEIGAVARAEPEAAMNGLRLAACAVASLGGLLFGFDTAVISGTVLMVSRQFGLSPLREGMFTSSALAGCILGAALSGILADRLGRKPVLVASGILFVASAVGCAVPATYSALIGARLIGGVAVGIASVVAPLYITEFAPARSRGRLVAFYQLSIVCGILLAYLSNWLIALNAGSSSFLPWHGETAQRIFITEYWRAMFGAALLPSLAFTALLMWVPESPRWLARRGRRDAALAIAGRLGGMDVAPAAAAEQASWRQLFRPGLRMALLVAILLSVFGQLSGVNIVVYYGPKILASAGYANGAALLGQVAFGVINLIFTLVAMAIIDSLGRRPLLIKGMAVVTATLAIIGFLFLRSDAAGAGSVPAAMGLWIGVLICVYMAAIAVSICAVIWVITAEIFPTQVRGRGCSIATFANWTTNAVSALLFPSIVDRWGMGFGCFLSAAICGVATWFFWRFVPETKGRSLEEIEQYWARAETGKIRAA
jgi:MFS transporter, SP family, arabinose:H+ symporter